MKALIFAVAAALSFSAVALAAEATTLPSKTVTVVVLFTDKGMIFAPYEGETLGNGTPGLAPLPGPVPRGDYLRFVVYNRGKKLHNFKIFGKKTASIKPGGKAAFNKLANRRGTFAYGSTLDKGKAFHGKLIIA